MPKPSLGTHRAKRTALWAVALALITFAVHLPLIDYNRADFSDAVMQVGLFENRNAYFPPLYTAGLKALALIGLDDMSAGRLLSSLAAGGSIVLVYFLGARLHSSAAGMFAALVFTCSPVPWRWSLHAMGDSLFAFLFLFSLSALPGPGRGKSLQRRNFLSGTCGLFLGGLATLTRYQGTILLPLWALHVVRAGKERKRSTLLLSAAVAVLPWIGALLWAILWGFDHTAQFGERTGRSLAETAGLYGFMVVSFVRYLPLALGCGVTVLALVGLAVWLADRRQRFIAITWLGMFLVWLVAHAAFQSFQFRYFLPLVPLFCILAAVGAFGVGGRFRLRSIPWFLLVLLCAEGGLRTVRVLAGTRNTFADIRAAAEFCRSQPPGVRVFSNEVYNPKYRTPKMRYWSRREVLYATAAGNPDGGKALALVTPAGPGGEEEPFEPIERGEGFILCWHNVYSEVRAEDLARLCPQLEGAGIIFDETFTNVPRLPDIMSSRPLEMHTASGIVRPNITSWPQAMEYREMPQNYRTVVFEVGPQADWPAVPR